MRKKVFLLILQVYSYLCCLSQTSAPDFRIPDFLPPSPDAAALIKSGLVGASLSTGAVNVNIPLYTFSGNKYSLPLSLSYSTTGVRVNDISSFVGTGWNLEFGGVVTRTVLGLPDEMRGEGGSLNNFTSPPLNTLTQGLLDYLGSAQADRETDIFSFNVLGMSGSFYLDSLFNPVSLTKTNLRIAFSPYGDPEYPLGGFDITDDKGIIYRLTEVETTMKRGLPGNKCKSIFGYDDLMPQPTAWYLSCIKINTNDSIVFHYNSGTSKYDGEVTQTLSKCIASSFGVCTPAQAYPLYNEELSTCYSTVTNGVKYVNEIIFYDGSKALFGYDNQRPEVLNGQRLKSIKIYNPTNKLVKYFRLASTLYTSNSTIGDPPELALANTSKYRSFLDRVEDVNIIDTTQVLSYVFQYNAPGELPKRLSFAQDHWGYYNGANNTYLMPYLPGHDYASYFDGDDGNPVKNGNREPSLSHMLYGTLQKVTYPTGGHDTLQYEAPFVVKYDTVKHITPTYIQIQNGDEWNELVQDTIYIPFDQVVEIDCGCARNVTPPDFHGSCTFNITPHNPAIPTLFYNNITVNDATSHHMVFLKAGYYTMSASGTWDSTLSTLEVRHQHAPPTLVPYNALIGGVIIGRIQSFTDQGKLALDKIYKYSAFPDSTTYDLKALPTTQNYINVTEERKTMSCLSTEGAEYVDCSGDGVGTFLTLNSSIVNPLSVTGASPYYFKNVIEYVIDRNNNKNGYTLHQFSFADELGFIYDPPVPIYGSRQLGTPYNYIGNFVAGEERTRQYEKYTGGYRLLTDKKKYYSLQKTKEILNHRVRKKFELPCSGVNASFLNAFDLNTYRLWLTFIKTDSIEDITYTSLGDSLRTMTRLYYDNPSYTYANRTVTQNSEGKTIENSQQFPHDLTASSYNASGLITKMIQKNLVSPGLIHTLKVNTAVTDKLITTYREYPVSSNDFVIDSVQKYSQSSLSNYLFNSTYDNRLNVTGMLSQQQPPAAFIWDYASMYPIAKVTQAAPADIAYSSFETSNAGNWTLTGGSINTTYSITGARSYSLTTGNTITKSSLTTGDYLVSYWSKNGSLLVNSGTGTSLLTKNGWTLYEHLLTSVSSVSIAVSGTAVIDELRLYPKLGQMTTYTYTPLIGLTSQADARNNIVYYEYDGFNRLLRIRDWDQHIVKQMEYQYQVPAHANAVWTVTGATRCKPCPGNSAYIANILQNEEKDTNPHSPTYNSTRWTDAGVSGSCVVIADWQNTGNTQCLTDGSGYRTGTQRIEKKDMNPCSPTWNQLQYVDITNTSACPPNAPNWQTTGTTRCKSCPGNAAYITNTLQNEERDNNPNSSTYNQTRWTDAGTSGSCVISADWQNTATAIRCKQVSGVNTGEQEQEQRDMNHCSGTYNQTRWVVTGTNTTACPLPSVYARIEYEDVIDDGEYRTATIVIKFYSNAACTVPTSVSNLSVNYRKVRTPCSGSPTTTNSSVNCTGNRVEITSDYLFRDDGIHCFTNTFSVQPGTGYTNL